MKFAIYMSPENTRVCVDVDLDQHLDPSSGAYTTDDPHKMAQDCLDLVGIHGPECEGVSFRVLSDTEDLEEARRFAGLGLYDLMVAGITVFPTVE